MVLDVRLKSEKSLQRVRAQKSEEGNEEEIVIVPEEVEVGFTNRFSRRHGDEQKKRDTWQLLL